MTIFRDMFVVLVTPTTPRGFKIRVCNAELFRNLDLDKILDDVVTADESGLQAHHADPTLGVVIGSHGCDLLLGATKHLYNWLCP